MWLRHEDNPEGENGQALPAESGPRQPSCLQGWPLAGVSALGFLQGSHIPKLRKMAHPVLCLYKAHGWCFALVFLFKTSECWYMLTRGYSPHEHSACWIPLINSTEHRGSHNSTRGIQHILCDSTVTWEDSQKLGLVSSCLPCMCWIYAVPCDYNMPWLGVWL